MIKKNERKEGNGRGEANGMERKGWKSVHLRFWNAFRLFVAQ